MRSIFKNILTFIPNHFEKLERKEKEYFSNTAEAFSNPGEFKGKWEFFLDRDWWSGFWSALLLCGLIWCIATEYGTGIILIAIFWIFSWWAGTIRSWPSSRRKKQI